MNPPQGPQENQVKASDEDLKGRFSNAANVYRIDDHFLIDYFLNAPPVGQMVSRIIMTPGHLKRLRDAIDRLLTEFEKESGKKIDVASEAPTIGFRTPAS